MSVPESSGVTSGDAPPANLFQNFKEYARSALDGVDFPVKPKDLAKEYGCGPDHARNSLSEMVQDGEADRVGRGLYSSGTGRDEYNHPEGGVVAEENNEGNAELSDDEDAGDMAGSDTDMPTKFEYDQQREKMEETAEASDNTREPNEPGNIDEEAEESVTGVPKEALMALGVVLIIGVIVYIALSSRGGGDGSNASTDDEDASETEADTSDSYNGLIE